MYDNDSKGISYTAGFFMLIAFAIAGLTMASLLGGSVWTAMTGLGADQLAAGMSNPAYSNVFKSIQVINEVLGYFVPAVFVAFMLNRRPMQLLGFSTAIKARQIGLVVLIVAAALMVGNALSNFNHWIPIPADWKLKFDQKEADYALQAKAILGLKNFGDYLVAIFVMAFIPAVCEETLFRGGLQNLLARSTNRPWLAVILVSLLFSAAHDSFYGFLFRFFLGAVLGLIYQYSGRLWLAILAHFLNNALTVTVYYIYTRQGKSVDEAMNSTNTSWWTIFILPVLIIFFTLFRRISPKTRAI
jgi:uncharacterized protein